MNAEVFLKKQQEVNLKEYKNSQQWPNRLLLIFHQQSYYVHSIKN